MSADAAMTLAVAVFFPLVTGYALLGFPSAFGNKGPLPRYTFVCESYSWVERLTLKCWRSSYWVRDHCWHNSDNPQCCRCGKYHPDYYKEN